MLHTEYKLFWKIFGFWLRSFIIVREVWLQLIFEGKNWYSKKYMKKYTAEQRLNLILSEKVRLKRPYRSHYFTMSRSEQVNLKTVVFCYALGHSEFAVKLLTQAYPLSNLMYLLSNFDSILKWVRLNMSLSHIEYFQLTIWIYYTY